MKDIVNSFKAHLYERTSSPLLGAFIFYWLICNYKMVIILLDDKLNSKNKFLEIDILYKEDIVSIPNLINIPLNGLLIPIAITLIYILIFPFISNLLHKAWIWHQNKLKEISNGKVLTKIEFGELHQKFTELELSFDDKFQKKDSEILKLKSILEKKDKLVFEYQSKIDSFEKTISLKDNEINQIRINMDNYYNNSIKKDEEINNLNHEIKDLKPNISELEEQIMKLYVPNYKKIFGLSEIRNELNTTELKTNYIVKQLVKNGYLDNHDKNGYIISGYVLTDKGEDLLVEKNFIE